MAAYLADHRFKILQSQTAEKELMDTKGVGGLSRLGYRIQPELIADFITEVGSDGDGRRGRR